ncbi:MAG: AcrR family transcriptional regulator [Patiriisocius sp.]|jgi:AcrR family transcriptional regulator
MTKPVRTRLSPEKRRKQLLTTAGNMIVAGGLQSFRMEALAKQAGVTAPLVYNYFSSRPELLQALLLEEYRAFNDQVRQEISSAQSFEEIVLVFIKSNFDHFSAGNILPILQSQPEILIAIRDEQKTNSRQTAEYLVSITAKSFELTIADAELVASMSSGASIAAAQYAARHSVDLDETIDLAVKYVLAGMQAIGQASKKKPRPS